MPDVLPSSHPVSPLFPATEAGQCVTDSAGTFLRVNEVFCWLHGRTESELVGYPVSVLATAPSSDLGGTLIFGAGYLDLLRGVLGERAELRFPAPTNPGFQMVATARSLTGMAGGVFTATTVTVGELHRPECPGDFIGGDPGLAILAAIGDGIIGSDLNGIIDSFDAGAERLFGYAAFEVIGSNVSILMPEANSGKHDHYMAEARTGRGKRGGERQRQLIGRRKDGAGFPLLLLLNERPADASPGYTAVLLHDGDHEMNRSSLEQTSARLYAALGALKEGFLLCDARDRIVLANARMRTLFPEIADLIVLGRSFELLVRACAARGLYELGEISVDDWVAERVARHRRLPCQFEMNVCGGRRIDVRELATAEGASLTIYDDITERHIREQQLRDREIQLSTAQRIARLGSWRVDVKTGNISWSHEMYRLFGVESGAFSLSPELVFGCIHPEDRERVRRQLIGRSRRNTVREWEFRIMRPSGEERVLWAESQCEIDRHGEVVARFGVCQDVTARKLDELALIQARDAAEQANNSKSHFLANMSHELRTPLNAIIGFSEMMASEVLGSLGNDRYRDYAESILSSGSHLLDLINEVLDLSKIEAGHYELTEELLEVAEAFEDAVRQVGPKATEKGTTIANSVRFAPELRADRRALRQMLLNLLSNAVKFSPAGGQVIMSATWGVEGLRLSVSDTGVGIPAERIKDLAQPFVQVDTSMNRRHTGTGIGLYLTRCLIELHGGSLCIESRQGEGSGTTVSLLFPTERLNFNVEN
ncbi:MAG: PAS domain S-box protein [Rhodospirillaceae bacterium]